MQVCLTVVVTTTGRPTLRATLNSLVGLNPRYDDVVIMVDGDSVELRKEINNAVTFSSIPAPPRIYYHPVPDACWGHGLRNEAIKLKGLGTHMAFMDDDDVYAPGAFKSIRETVSKNPIALHLFAMKLPTGELIPNREELICGNVGTPCGVIPTPTMLNSRSLSADRLGEWGRRYEGDFDFYQSCRPGLPVLWHLEKVIAHIRPHEVTCAKV